MGYNRDMRILVVEDDRKVGAFLQRGLREEHYAVDLCRSGKEGLYLAQVNPYDILILDIMLPEMDGVEICRELRRRNVRTPVLMLTARDSIEDKVRGLSEGADDYLTKPFSFEELLARVRALLRRDRDYKAESLEAGDLKLDPVRRMVTRGGRRIELTGKEYALLEYLLRNRGRVVTPTMIRESVWDMDYEGSSNLVHVYINRLRRKIDRGFERPLIRTVRGFGYQIHENS